MLGDASVLLFALEHHAMFFVASSGGLIFYAVGTVMPRINESANLFVFKYSAVMAAIGIACGVTLIALGVSFLFEPFLGHVESQVASVSALAARGEPIYIDPHGPHRYSLLYGPITYLLHSFVITASGGAIWSVKFIGVTCLLATIGAFSGLLWRFRKTPSEAAILTLFSGSFLLYFFNWCFAPTADSIQLAIASVTSLLVVSSSSWTFKALGLAAGAGLLVGLKLHAVISVAPLGVILFVQPECRLRAAIVPIVVFFVIAVAPFLHPSVDIINYITILKYAANHGFSGRRAAGMVIGCAVALVAITIGCGAVHNRGARLVQIAFVASAFITSVFASKSGAGAHHLLPLLPVSLACCSLNGGITRSPRLANTREGIMIGPLLIGTGIITIFAIDGAVDAAQERMERLSRASLARTEMRMWLDRFSDSTVQILPGGDRSLESAQNRTIDIKGKFGSLEIESLQYIPVLVGHPLFLSTAAEMDFFQSGIPFSAAARAELESCGSRIWLVPRGERPLSGRTLYPPADLLFPVDLSRTLLERWRLIDEAALFSAYQCKSEAEKSAIPDANWR